MSACGTESATGSIPITYRLDRHDVIIAVNDAFWFFADDNDGSVLRSASVLGRPLWEFIKGSDTVELYQQLLRWVREQSHALSFPYRCDSPGTRRYLQMSVQPHPGGDVVWQSRLVKVENRSPTPSIYLASMVARTAVFRCSLCNRFRYQEQWLEIEQAVRRAQLFNQEKPPGLYHSLCNDCRSDLSQRCRLASA